MITHKLNTHIVHPSWNDCLKRALSKVDPNYLTHLSENTEWLPGREKIFSAFSLPVDKVKYILFGESPYPRIISANGYAFWDAAVKEIWNESGMSKAVNRATSLRNFIKMLLVAENALTPEHTSQEDIAALDKTHFAQTNEELFFNFLHHGFLLLNATLVLQATPVKKDANAWRPFIKEIINYLLQQHHELHLILFGKIANVIDELIGHPPGLKKLVAEHPYNHSFISNKEVINFFKPLHLLLKK